MVRLRGGRGRREATGTLEKRRKMKRYGKMSGPE